jgi:uncharacterized repeat protein (TIGR03803 family)
MAIPILTQLTFDYMKPHFLLKTFLCSLVLSPLFIQHSSAQVLTALHSFTTSDGDGEYPLSVLVQAGGSLYGTTEFGGSAGNGTVFAVNTNGTSYTILHSFSTRVDGLNDDGAYPLGGLVLSGGTLYGTTWFGGASGQGTVFHRYIQFHRWV